MSTTPMVLSYVLVSVVCVVVMAASWYFRPFVQTNLADGKVGEVLRSIAFTIRHLAIAAAAVFAAAVYKNMYHQFFGADLSDTWSRTGAATHFDAVLPVMVFVFTTGGRYITKNASFGKFLDATFACALAFSKIGVYMSSTKTYTHGSSSLWATLGLSGDDDDDDGGDKVAE